MAKPILLVVFATAIFWSTALLAQEQAPAPSFKEGDTWQFNISRKEQFATSTEQNEGLYELSIRQGAVRIYQIEGSQKNEMTVQPDGPMQALLRLIGKSDQRPDLKFPLSVGQKWTYGYQTRFPNTRQDQRRSAEVNVTGIDQVTVPAGSFKTYKLIKSESWSIGGTRAAGTTNSTTSTYFYSPETRSIVKASTMVEKNPGTIETELIKFTPGN
jgi:hypothetical protein